MTSTHPSVSFIRIKLGFDCDFEEFTRFNGELSLKTKSTGDLLDLVYIMFVSYEVNKLAPYVVKLAGISVYVYGSTSRVTSSHIFTSI